MIDTKMRDSCLLSTAENFVGGLRAAVAETYALDIANRERIDQAAASLEAAFRGLRAVGALRENGLSLDGSAGEMFAQMRLALGLLVDARMDVARLHHASEVAVRTDWLLRQGGI